MCCYARRGRWVAAFKTLIYVVGATVLLPNEFYGPDTRYSRPLFEQKLCGRQLFLVVLISLFGNGNIRAHGPRGT